MKNTGKKKSSKNIGMIVGRVLTVILVLGVLFAIFSIYRQDQIRAAAGEGGLEESPIKIDRNKDYGEAGFNQIAKNEKFTLYTDFTTGEICVQENATEYKWYSNPLDREDDKIIAKKPTLNAQLYLTCWDQENKITKEEDSYSGSVKKGNMNHELVENGIKYTFAFPTTGVVVPVQYTLNEDGLLAEVLVDQIDEQWINRYTVTSITFLPWFGAGNLTDEGYLFVPDGSGAVMEFNNGKNRFSFYTAQVYGPNNTTADLSSTVNEQAQMPIFGINKKTEDETHGLLAVITKGDTASTIIATTSRKTSSYNCAYVQATIREYRQVNMNRYNGAYGKECVNADMTDTPVVGDSLSVQYFLLDEGAAEYSDMANCYRDYLLDNGGLKKSDLADKNYMILDLYGAVSIEKYVMGIKRPIITPLTTYNDVVNIVKELKSQGVENLIINYIGALDDGLNNKIYTKVKTESKLGSAKEFNAMLDYLEQEGVILFLETNPIELHKNGNGYNTSKDAVKGFFQNNIFLNNVKLDSGDRDASYRWRLLQPYQVPEAVKKYAASVAEKANGNVSIAKIGEMLYSNYDSDEELYSDRRQTLDYWKDALKAASEQAEHLLVHKGNIYCAPYADVIVDTPSTGSQYDMVDYSVPFLQMLLRGGSVLGTEAINSTVNYNQALLKALETGSSLKYSLVASDVKDLIGTEFNYMMSYSYDFWKDTMVAQYKAMQEASKQTEGQTIVDHCYLQDGVTLTEYANGTSILVNYTDSNFYYNGKTIAGGTYLVQGGTE